MEGVVFLFQVAHICIFQYTIIATRNSSKNCHEKLKNEAAEVQPENSKCSGSLSQNEATKAKPTDGASDADNESTHQVDEPKVVENEQITDETAQLPQSRLLKRRILVARRGNYFFSMCVYNPVISSVVLC